MFYVLAVGWKKNEFKQTNKHSKDHELFFGIIYYLFSSFRLPKPSTAVRKKKGYRNGASYQGGDSFYLILSLFLI